MYERFKMHHPTNKLLKGPNVSQNFAKILAKHFNYNQEILDMFAKRMTAIRVKKWNLEISKYKKMTLRGRTKTAEYVHQNS